MRINLTVKYIESLKPKPDRYQVMDQTVRGLGILVFPSGAKKYFHVRKIQGVPKLVTLGDCREMDLDYARGKASERNSKLTRWKADNYEGANPILKPERAPSLGDVLDHYIENHVKRSAKNPEQAETYRRWQFGKYLSSWRDRSLGSISREEVRRRHAEIAKANGNVTANRTITFLRTLYGHATHPDVALYDGANPASKPKKFLADETSRERVLQKNEYAVFLKTLRDQPNEDLKHAVLLALFTGQRRGSVLAMRWQDLDFKRGLWTVTERKGKKGTEPHIVPLTSEALLILSQRERTDDVFVFPGRKENTALTTLKKPWTKFIEQTGIQNLTFHDLRRSLASTEGDAGAPTEIIQKTLGHEQSSVATKIYDRSNRRDEVRQAMKKATSTMLRSAKISAKKLLEASHAEA